MPMTVGVWEPPIRLDGMSDCVLFTASRSYWFQVWARCLPHLAKWSKLQVAEDPEKWELNFT